MDNFYEHLYKRKKRPQDLAFQVAVLCVVLGTAALALVFLRGVAGFMGNFLAAIVCVGILYFGYKLFMRFDIEYEYTYLDGEIDIDKIMSKTSRKRMITVQTDTFRKFGIYDKKEIENLKREKFDTVINVSSYQNDAVRYYATMKHTSQGITLLIFEPNDQILGAIKKKLTHMRNKQYE